MKVYEEVTEKRIRLKVRICDICGAKGYDTQWPGTQEHNYRATNVSMELGTHWPGSCSGIRTEVDICPKCFKEKLIPWLLSQGVKVEAKEYDY